MTTLLEHAITAGNNLPLAVPEDVACVIRHPKSGDDETGPVPLTPAERAAIRGDESRRRTQEIRHG
jgi:hypothetical protein